MEPALFSLDGKTAVITGANTGLGQGMAIALAKAGADIVTLGRSKATDTHKAIKALGRKGYDLSVDLSDRQAVNDIVGTIYGTVPHVDILVNNAGIIRRNDALDFTDEDWDVVMDVNLRATFFLAQNIAKRMASQNRKGKIINIASMLSFQGGIRVASYTASKSGVMGLTRLLANEWAGKGINVNAIAPGYFATNNTAALQADEKRNAEILGRIPVGRWGQPDDLGGAAIFLASEASDYVHGVTLPVDGGWLSR